MGRDYERGDISKKLVAILENMTRDWDTGFSGRINEESSLMHDCGFESIDIVMLIVEIEESFRYKGLPFQNLLMVDGRYVEDLTVRQVIDFLQRELAIGKGST
jgi:acyl carrier protein